MKMRTMLAGLKACGYICALMLTAIVASARQQEQPPFRAGVTLINVDAYPRGKDGRVVAGMRAEDFQVFEDGVPQKVDAFEFIQVAPNTPDTERRDPNTQEEGDRFRHAAVFQRWRPDKKPRDCRYDQLEVTKAFELEQVFGA